MILKQLQRPAGWSQPGWCPGLEATRCTVLGSKAVLQHPLPERRPHTPHERARARAMADTMGLRRTSPWVPPPPQSEALGQRSTHLPDAARTSGPRRDCLRAAKGHAHRRRAQAVRTGEQTARTGTETTESMSAARPAWEGIPAALSPGAALSLAQPRKGLQMPGVGQGFPLEHQPPAVSVGRPSAATHPSTCTTAPRSARTAPYAHTSSATSASTPARMHSGDKPFACRECNKAFPSHALQQKVRGAGGELHSCLTVHQLIVHSALQPPDGRNCLPGEQTCQSG